MRRIAVILLLSAAGWAQAPREATVRGHVFAREDGRPLRNAMLMLVVSYPTGIRYAVTDSRGAYEFRDVAPGRYRLDCHKAGYLPAELSPSGLPVARQDREGLDFRLLRSAAISGRVLDEDGEPLAGVTVSVTADTYGQGRRSRPLQTQTRTSQVGRYRLSGLRPGRYWVIAHFERTEFGYAPLFYFNALSPRDGRPVEVAAGGEADGVDFQMRRGTMLSRLAGRVVDERGRPVVGGSVTATLADVDLDRYAGGLIGRDGRFEIQGLVPGRYVVVISAPNRNPVTREIFVGGEVSLASIWMLPGTTVRGRIIFAGDRQLIRDRIVDLIGWDQRTGSLDPDLTFEIRGVQPGRYRVEVRSRRGVLDSGLSDGSNPFYVATVLVGESDVTESGIPVLERQAPINVEVILGADGGAVKGELRNEAGQPLTEGQAVLAPADPRHRYNARYFKAVMADDKGRFAIRGIMPGTYLLFPWPYGNVVNLLRPELFARLEKFAAKIVVEKESEVSQDLEVSKDFRAIVDSWIP